jgi:uncharacterized protein (TIGR00661 family)
MTTETRPILFVINGLGLGNSTRCAAVIRKLRSEGHIIDVATSGNGLRFFAQSKDIRHLFPMTQSHYQGANTRIGFFSILLSTIKFPVKGVRNFVVLLRVIRQVQPSVIVSDSSYNLVSVLYPKIPRISLNNSRLVVSQIFHSPKIILSHLPQFMVELADAAFQRIIPEMVIEPWPARMGKERSNRVQVPPIVREEFNSTENRFEEVKNILVLYSGSGIGTDVHQELAEAGMNVTVVGRAGQSTSQLFYAGENFECSQLLKKADAVVTSGGFSAISEVIAAKRPVIVLPIEGHAEQFINAQWIVQLGLGLMGEPGNLKQNLAQLESNLPQIQEAFARLDFHCDGDKYAAQIISERIKGKRA